VGGGLIGSSAALALADGGLDVVLITESRAGAASAAAAGMLAPSMELTAPQMTQLATTARDMYPEFVAALTARTEVKIELNREGLLEIAGGGPHAAELMARAHGSGTWLDCADVATVEPGILAPHGAVLWPLDGAVDNTQLLSALRVALAQHARVRVLEAAAESLNASERHASIVTTDGTRVSADRVVVAAGAWSGQIPGAPLARVIEPVRGQLVALEGQPLRHVVYGPGCYLVPRGGRTIAGSTMERVGFDSGTTDQALAALRAAAVELCPAVKVATSRAWAGLRPVTPDLLPLLGPDSRTPSLLYACGHSRNGVLLAPLTALLLKQLIFEEPLTFDVARFRPDRFRDTFTRT
jgi:glycine oxidase